MKILGTTSDDDYVTNGAVVGGHVANLTTRLHGPDQAKSPGRGKGTPSETCVARWVRVRRFGMTTDRPRLPATAPVTRKRRINL